MRQLRTRGYSCEVIAPAKVPRRAGDRIKTDRRDALLLARAARAGQLVSVTIPDERDEASARPYTDLVRSPGRGFVSSSMFGGRLELSLLAASATEIRF